MTLLVRRNVSPNDLSASQAAQNAALASGAAGQGAALLGDTIPLTGAVARTQHDRNKLRITPLDFGAVGDGSTDDTTPLAVMFAIAPSNSDIDLLGLPYAVYNSVVGTAGTADATPLASTLRIAGKTGITVRNGHIFAANPGATGTRVNFPSTLTIDGCSGINLLGVRLGAKGDGYGNSDASAPFTSEQRRNYLAQNGGHALVMIRSNIIGIDGDCRFERAGSVGAVYSSSSDEIFVGPGAYASAMSLGYAAFAADSWCGDVSVSLFPRHRLYLFGARSDNNGTAYGSKGCVVVEDVDCYAYVHGGVYKDAYANGGAHTLGAAFIANDSHVYVHGADVENCAAVGMTTNATNHNVVLECTGVNAKGLRTSMHIFDKTSVGSHAARYVACIAEIVGGSLWPDLELSVTTVVACLKVTTSATIDLLDCRTTGADTFALNATRAAYGGIRAIGGRHDVVNRIFDSVGWGGSAAGTGRGFELGGGVRFYLSSTAPSTALSVATTAANAITNKDPSGTFTYQFVDIDRSVVMESATFREMMSVSNMGAAGLAERRFLGQRLVNCFQAANSAGDSYAGSLQCVSVGTASGGNIPVTFVLLDNKKPSSLTTVDDAMANRKLVSIASGPTVVSGALQVTLNMNSTLANFTQNSIYPANFAG